MAKKEQLGTPLIHWTASGWVSIVTILFSTYKNINLAGKIDFSVRIVQNYQMFFIANVNVVFFVFFALSPEQGHLLLWDQRWKLVCRGQAPVDQKWSGITFTNFPCLERWYERTKNMICIRSPIFFAVYFIIDSSIQCLDQVSQFSCNA